MLKPAIKVAVIGYGWWGQTITKLLQDCPLIDVGLVVEVSMAMKSQASEDAKTMGFRVEQDLQAALQDSQIDALILCTPHSEHAQQIMAGAKAKKHIFCEKPLCLSFTDAQQSIQACIDNHVALGLGHERRFEQAIVDLKNKVRQGELGTLLQIEANFSQNKFLTLAPDNWRLSKELAPCGPLAATGIHLVDLAISLLGPASSVYARLNTLATSFANGDTLAIALNFPSGATALISAILTTPFDGRFCVYGSKGWIEVRDRTHPEHPTGWDVTHSNEAGEVSKTFYAPASSVRANLESFARSILDPQHRYPVSLAEMLANVAALEAIMKSAQSQQIVPIEQ